MKNTKIEYKHPRTVWEFIKSDIEVLIIRGILKNADKVPSISEIAKQYNVGKTTAKKVLETMYIEGTLTKQRGIGYFVKPYTKEKLKKEHLKELEEILLNGINLAKKLAIDENELKEIFCETICKDFNNNIQNIKTR